MLKVVSLSKDGSIKLFKGVKELYPKDIDDSVKSCIPGEWIFLKNEKKELSYLGYVNPLVPLSTPIIQVFDKHKIVDINEWEYLKNQISHAILKRELFKEYGSNSRLVYGQADFLPGLIIDSYVNTVIVQINTAGIDRFRENIKEFIQEKYPTKNIYLLDNEQYRQRENLPVFQVEALDEDIEIDENNIKYKVSKDKFQKVGYYYDHRENRKRAKLLVDKFEKKFSKGLDLFCYIGSWGLNLLGENLEKVTFVDQGDFQDTIQMNLDLNGFSGRGSYERANVFEYLSQKVSSGEKFDLICSDPPAFCKSKKEERKAYEGYLKLHKSILKLIEKNGLFIACSCTHYINFESFQRNVEEAASSTGRKIQLIDCGVQGIDHPTTNLNNKHTYLKYFAYLVE